MASAAPAVVTAPAARAMCSTAPLRTVPIKEVRDEDLALHCFRTAMPRVALTEWALGGLRLVQSGSKERLIDIGPPLSRVARPPPARSSLSHYRPARAQSNLLVRLAAALSRSVTR